MLLSVLQDETCPEGRTGILTFARTNPPAAEAKTENQSSTPRSSGTFSAKSAGKQGGSVLQTILREAGIRL